MSVKMKHWIISHPRSLYIAVIPGMIFGFVFGFFVAGDSGAALGGPFCLFPAMYGWAYLRRRLLRSLTGLSVREHLGGTS
jgi:hypothetical protein